ncbi:hypothetical protein [Segatella copri]|uniref:hypothetical protein n=1 Tax=Segatella copri TaxID=165179 RepID=UPI0015F300B2|nr:hypothetical protein [Segatella copri]
MKHLMSSKLLIAFVMVLCWNSVKASDFITVDGFKYYVDTTKGEATILANDYEGDIVIPSVVALRTKTMLLQQLAKMLLKIVIYRVSFWGKTYQRWKKEVLWGLLCVKFHFLRSSLI